MSINIPDSDELQRRLGAPYRLGSPPLEKAAPPYYAFATRMRAIIYYVGISVGGAVFRFILFWVLAAAPLLAYHQLDITGGSGFLWAGVARTSSLSLSSDTVEGKTTENIPMRETIFLGLRYSNYSPSGDGFFVFGFESTGTLARPLIQGQQKFIREDSSGRQIEAYTEDLTAASAPAFNSLRGSVHLGYQWLWSGHFSAELGILTGVSAGQAKADYRYNFSGRAGSGGGLGGIGAHIAGRASVNYLLSRSVVLAVEYRLMAEIFGNIAWIPGLISSSSSLDNYGHLFLFSAGYRFGMGAVPEKAAPEPAIPTK